MRNSWDGKKRELNSREFYSRRGIGIEEQEETKERISMSQKRILKEKEMQREEKIKESRYNG